MVHPLDDPTFLLGPVLYFRGEQGDRWRLSALFVLEGDGEPDDLRVDGVSLPVPPRHVGAWRGRHVWRFDFAVPRGREDGEAGYGFPDGPRWAVTVPARQRRPRIAFVTGSGTADEGAWDKAGGADARTHLWRGLLDAHGATPFHLLLHGGGQIDADSVWEDCPLLAKWAKGNDPQRLTRPFTAPMAEEVMDFYFSHYIALWSRREMADAFARIPSLMMWDDHDIFSGWGTLGDGAQGASVNRGVFMVARHTAAMFQMGAATDAMPELAWGTDMGTFTQGVRLGDVGIFALDLRTERTAGRVFSNRTWRALPEWLARFNGCRHLLLLSGVPLVFSDTSQVERLMDRLPGRQGVEEDLRGQWRSQAHAEEWRYLVELLAGFSLRSACRITVLSGGIGAGACGVLHGGGVDIRQVISAGIVQPPLSTLTAFGLERLAAREDEPIDGYSLSMLPFTENGKRLIRARTWVSLGFDPRAALHAQWNAEGRPDRYRVSF